MYIGRQQQLTSVNDIGEGAFVSQVGWLQIVPLCLKVVPADSVLGQALTQKPSPALSRDIPPA